VDVATTTVGLTDLKFRAVREDFADAVAWVARNLPSRPTVPVLAGVLLTATDSGLTISGFDYEVSAEVQVAAEIASAGSVLVSGRLLAEITRALPAKPVDIAVDGTRVSLTCGSARFSLPTMPVEDYPALPTLPEETGVVPTDLFAEAIGQVAVAAGRDDTLPMLTGIRVEISGETVVLAATDRFRLAVRELTGSTRSPDLEAAVLVPAKTPRAIVTRLNQELVRVIRLPDITAQILQVGADVIASSPEETDKLVRADLKKYADVIRKLNIKPE